MADRAPNEIITITARVRDVSYFLRENDDDDMRPTRVTIICDDIPAACRDAEHPTIIEAMSYHWFEPERGQPYKLKGHFKQFTGSEAYFFKVLSVRRQKLDDSTKIMKLLTAYSDMTPAMAERISQRYDTLDSFLQAESAYGQHIDAATKRKWNADAAVIREHPELSNELSLYGLKACKIAQFYEDTGYKAIRRCKNAYMLMDYGASFRQIDELSLMRLEPVDSTERLCAALTDALNDICESGDCYLPMDRFIAATIKKLSLARTKAITGDIIKNTIPAVKDIHIDADNSVYPFRLFEAETAIAREIKRIVGNKKPISANSTLPRNLDHKQLEAVFMPLRHGVSIVTGGPGTGKTTLLQSMIEVLNSACPNSRILLCAPTGRAAKRMEEICGIPAQTIHAATGYRPGVNAYQYIHHDDTPEMEYDYIIVDEASMLDVELCWVLLALVPDGATVVLIGDTYTAPHCQDTFKNKIRSASFL